MASVELHGFSMGGITYDPNPFDPGSSGELFLKHAGVNFQPETSACVDLGMDLPVADGLTTRHDEVRWTPTRPTWAAATTPIGPKATLTADDTEVTWSVSDANFCLLFYDADGTIVRIDDPGDDSMDHGPAHRHAAGLDLLRRRRRAPGRVRDSPVDASDSCASSRLRGASRKKTHREKKKMNRELQPPELSARDRVGGNVTVVGSTTV